MPPSSLSFILDPAQTPFTIYQCLTVDNLLRLKAIHTVKNKGKKVEVWVSAIHKSPGPLGNYSEGSSPVLKLSCPSLLVTVSSTP